MPDGDRIEEGLDPVGAGVAGDPALAAALAASTARLNAKFTEVQAASRAAVARAEEDLGWATAFAKLSDIALELGTMFVQSRGQPQPPPPSKLQTLVSGAVGTIGMPPAQQQQALLGLLPGLLGR